MSIGTGTKSIVLISTGIVSVRYGYPDQSRKAQQKLTNALVNNILAHSVYTFFIKLSNKVKITLYIITNSLVSNIVAHTKTKINFHCIQNPSQQYLK